MRTTPALVTAALAAGIAVPAQAQSQDATDQRLEELERKVDILSEEAARKDSGSEDRLSIGGYGEGYFKSAAPGDNETDFYRQTIYLGYAFSDTIHLSAELEWEHSEETAVEFAYLDFMLSDRANVRAGMMLTPLGFINEEHEPTTYFGNIRPTVERQIIPTTSRENGVGLWGELGDSVEYKLYVQNSFDGSGLSGDNLRGIRQKGYEAKAEDLAVTGQLRWHPVTGTTLGVSGWRGNLGQGQTFDGQTPDVPMTLWDVHAAYERGNWRLRALYTQATLDDTLAVNNQALADLQSSNPGATAADVSAVAEKLTGWYVEAGYDIMPALGGPAEQSLYPWVRYSALDTQASLAS
ncbi:MAG TPA: hypothetical protein VKA55_00470, partial [Gammaproteobacteria bacterium]|nr:hypothetical protein [Gammaproteobacteria bacterium]